MCSLARTSCIKCLQEDTQYYATSREKYTLYVIHTIYPNSCQPSGFLTCPYCVQELMFQSSAISKSVSPTLFIPAIRPLSHSCRLFSAVRRAKESLLETLPTFCTLSGADDVASCGQKGHGDSLSDDKLSFNVAVLCSEDEVLSRSVASSEASALVVSGSTIWKPSSCNAHAQWKAFRVML